MFSVSPEPYLDIHGYDDATVHNLLRELKRMGIGGFNLEYRDPDQDPDWSELTARLTAAAQHERFGISLHGPSPDISSVNEPIREEALAAHRKALAAIGAVMRGFVYIIHPENGTPQRQPGDGEARLRLCRDALVELMPLARSQGARLALENMRHRVDNPDRTGMFADQLSSTIAGLDQDVVGICFDVGHANISEGAGLYDAFRHNAERMIHIHLDDNLGSDDEHLPPGQGNIDWARFYHVVRECGYAGMMQLEVKPPVGEDPLFFYQRNYAHMLRMSA